MKRMRILTMVLAFVLWGGLQVVSAQITDPNQQNQAQNQTVNQDMVSDAWERDWDNMNNQERQTFINEWNSSSNASEHKQRRQQELNNMTAQDRSEYDKKLQKRRNKWQSMSSNDRNEFGQRVQDYSNSASTTRNNSKR